MPGVISAADTSLPELQHNVRLLVEFAEAEIQAVRTPRESSFLDSSFHILYFELGLVCVATPVCPNQYSSASKLTKS